MAEKKNVVTYSGLKKIEEELQNLKVNKRREIAAKIKEAREQGDLSENAEYDAAKDEQRDIEARIEQLEAMLKNIEVVDEDEVDTGVVGIGCKVVVYDYEFDEKIEYDIVGSSQADIMNNKISDESPVGMALKGAKVGEEVLVEAPDGELRPGYLILRDRSCKRRWQSRITRKRGSIANRCVARSSQNCRRQARIRLRLQNMM